MANERMLAALGNGVRGGRWFSLIDKVYRAQTLKSGVAQSKKQRRSGGSGWTERGVI